MQKSKITVVCGHYGSGKTNFSVNLALCLAREGRRTAVADLDIVNPYFRTADFDSLFSTSGVELIAPRFAGSNLDLPVLPPRLASAIGEPDLSLIVDLGGDGDGAVALGGFAEKIRSRDWQMLYVVNRSRYLTDDLEAETTLLRSVERCARLEVTGLVNNTNLGAETTPELLLCSCGYLEELAARTGIPVAYTAVSEPLAAQLTEIPNLFPLQIFVKTPWQE